jgi:MbtH protein
VNSFDDEAGTYVVLINNEGQYSLWPAMIEVPAGWGVAHGEDTRKACLEFVNDNWTDMRPNSLVQEIQRRGHRVSGNPLRAEGRAR